MPRHSMNATNANLHRPSESLTIWLCFAAACVAPLTMFVCNANAQSVRNITTLSSPSIVLGHPFSAVKFVRRVHLAKDFVTLETEDQGHAIIARDSEGRVVESGAVSFTKLCDLPGLGSLPPCDVWLTSLFDPQAGLMWHWTDGEVGDKSQYVQVDLQPEQIAEALRLTSSLKKTQIKDSDSNSSVQDLGEHDLEGIWAKGERTTTVHPHGTDPAEVTIHEVWTSESMRLVLLVVDANSTSATISGLEHVSHSPDASLFRVPTERTLRHWKDGGRYAQPDLDLLTLWLVD